MNELAPKSEATLSSMFKDAAGAGIKVFKTALDATSKGDKVEVAALTAMRVGVRAYAMYANPYAAAIGVGGQLLYTLALQEKIPTFITNHAEQIPHQAIIGQLWQRMVNTDPRLAHLVALGGI